MGAAIAFAASFLFPGRSWGGFAVKALAMLAAGLVAALLLTGLYRDWRDSIADAARAEVQVRIDRATLDAWSQASERLLRKDEEKARIVADWSQRLQAERLLSQKLDIENARLQDAAEGSGIHGRQIR